MFRGIRTSLWLAAITLTMLFEATAFGQPACPSQSISAEAQSPSGADLLPNTTVTFQWTSSTAGGITRFDVSGGLVGDSPEILCHGSAGSTSCAMSGFSTPGRYQWVVKTITSSCPAGTASHTLFFTVDCSSTGPTLQLPADNATVNRSSNTSSVTLNWADGGADEYNVYIGTNGCSVNTPTASVHDGGLSYTPPMLQAATTYEWRVVAKTGSCPERQSACRRFTTAACHLSPASLDMPMYGVTLDDTKPVTFQWGVPSFVAGSDLMLSNDGGQTFTTTSTTGYMVNSTQNLPDGSYVWKVRTSYTNGCEPTTSNLSRFTIAAPSPCSMQAPALIAPANGATNVTSPVDFQWNAVAATASNSYDLYIAQNGNDFKLAGTTSDNHLPHIVTAGAVSWYVVRHQASCPDLKSAVSSFTAVDVTCGNASIALVSPTDGTTTASPVTFSWTAVSGATAYRLWIGVNGEPANAFMRSSDTRAVVAIPAGNIEWFVEALLPTCPSVISPHGHFVVQSGASCGSDQPPVLVSPLGTSDKPASSSTQVTFNWMRSTGAIGYSLWIAPVGQDFTAVGFTNDLTLTRNLPAGTYNWFVEAYFAGCPPLDSTRAVVQVGNAAAACNNASPTNVSPAADATNVDSNVTFAWSPVSGADQYRLFVARNDGSYVLADSPDDSTTTISLAPGTYSWFVEAVFKSCPATRATATKFSVPRGQTCSDAAPQLVAPANGATSMTSPVAFSWQGVPNATKYILFARVEDGVATALAETTDTQIAKRLPSGHISWFVVAEVRGCDPVSSNIFTFTIPLPANCDAVRPLVVAPEEGSVVTSPVTLAWTAVPNVKNYRVWAAVGSDPLTPVGTTPGLQLTVTLPSGPIHWFAEALIDGCPATISALSGFSAEPLPANCQTPDAPRATVVGAAQSDTPYSLHWSSLANVTLYEVDESTAADFASQTTQITSDISALFTHTAATQPTQYFYRVRGLSGCDDQRGAFSDPVSVFVTPPQSSSVQHLISTEVGSKTAAVQTIFLPGSSTPRTFSATGDKPWITVIPSSGPIPAAGIMLSVSIDPAALSLGTNTGTILITYGGSGKGAIAADDTTSPATVPVSISLVTPVGPGGKGTPPPNALIIPAIAHAAGANNSQFQSDVRITNASAIPMTYRLTFTPSGVDGTVNGSESNIDVSPGSTTALDDILANFFGQGNAASVTGVLEIRPLTDTPPSFGASGAFAMQSPTIASSRTYDVTTNGTFGQFIPAIPFGSFIGKSSSNRDVLSLQQIAQSAAYRTNIGLVESNGEAANVMLTVFDNGNHILAEIPVSLLAGEHLQQNFLAANGLNLTDGRVEVKVLSDTGKVTAYASVLDNQTNDPLLVSPVLVSSVSGSRTTIPGVADLNNGLASWRTDIRVFNPGATASTATLTYYPQGAPAQSQQTTITLQGGEVRAIDNTLQSLFHTSNSGGSMVITTSTGSSVVATARTYNQTSAGTYGQFIPSVAVADSAALNGRTLQVLQLEQSNRYRTNIGLAETSGSAATAEVSVILPDSKIIPKIQIPLQANEFQQFPLSSFGLGTLYNARVTVKVISGTGTVTAYGSVIDQITQDPTYIPAQ